MKKHILIIGALLLGYTNFSCSSDDNEDNQTIEGTYELTSIISSKQLDPDANGSFDDDELIDDVACDSRIVLNEDGTFVFKKTEIYQPGGWSNSIPNYEVINCDTDSIYGTYTTNDGSLILTYINNYEEIENEIFEITNGMIEIKTQGYLFVKENNSISRESVAITMIYKK